MNEMEEALLREGEPLAHEVYEVSDPVIMGVDYGIGEDATVTIAAYVTLHEPLKFIVLSLEL